MKTTIKNLVAILVIAFAFFSCESTSPVDPIQESSVKSDYIITINTDGNAIQSINIDAEVSSILSKHNIDISSVFATYSTVITGFAASLTTEEVKSLLNDKRIQLIEQDFEILVVDNIESVEDSKGTTIQAQSISWGITAVGGFVEANETTGVAWIVDTGIDLDHPDLNVDLTLSKTFVTSGKDAASADDLNGHGSHCAGVVAAKNNTEGVVGVCANAKVIAVKVLSYRGSGTVSTIIQGLDYVGKNLIPEKLNVVNMSLGGSASTTLDNAVKNLAELGAYVVVAAGNSAKPVTSFSPSRVESNRVYVISAHDNLSKLASFSNYGNPTIDYAAPGVSIKSCYKNGLYATMSGTSMATPHAVGILLANNGLINQNGYIVYDKDLTPDKKAIR